MKKRIALLLTLLLCFAGCADTTEVAATTTETTAQTVAITTIKTTSALTASESTTATSAEETVPKENLITVSEYNFKETIKPVLEKHGIFYNSMKYLGAMKIEKWCIVLADEDEKVNMFDVPTKAILMTEEEKAEISDLPYMGDPHYFIADNKLCIYDDYLKNGFSHLAYYEYDLSDGKKICEYTETYQLNGELENTTSENCTFTSFEEVHKKIIDCGGALYKAQYDLPETYSFGYLPNITAPTEKEQLAILENAFYGEWENKDRNEERNLTYQDCYFSFEHVCFPQCFMEIDEGYVLQYINGGVLECFFIKKINPSVMYSTYYDFNISGITIDESTVKYARKAEKHSKEVAPGKISPLGQIKLGSMLGKNFDVCLNNTLTGNGSYTDENGIEWIYDVGGYGLPFEERYLISCSESKCELAIRYFNKAEFVDFIDGNYKTEPATSYFVLTFKKGDEGWGCVDVKASQYE